MLNVSGPYITLNIADQICSQMPSLDLMNTQRGGGSRAGAEHVKQAKCQCERKDGMRLDRGMSNFCSLPYLRYKESRSNVLLDSSREVHD